MSRIDDLIAQHCPDGVEFLAVAEIFEIRNGYTPSKSNPTFWHNGTVPWFRMEDIRANGRVLDSAIQLVSTSAVKKSGLYPANSIIMATLATIGEHALITVPFLANQQLTVMTPKPNFRKRLLPKFLYYYCFILAEWTKKNTNPGSVPTVDIAGFKRFRFPVPPVAVQRAIVEVLDTFSKLESELESELEARKQQYEHYLRTMTEPFEVGKRLRVGWTSAKIGQCCSLEKGVTPIQKAIPGKYPLVVTAADRRSSSSYQFDAAAACVPLVSSKGHGVASISNVYFQDGKFALGNILCAITPTNPTELSAEFLSYFLHARKDFLLVPLMRGGANVSLTVDSLRKVQIHFPPRSEQDRIVRTLQAMKNLADGQNFGLPAELAARRQQYEYYRDMLLAFKDMEGAG